jgi:hypothetical protein
MSSEDVRQKYRDEVTRQRAWEACQAAVEEARILEEQQGVIVPVVLVDRHPMLALLFMLCEREANAVAKQVRCLCRCSCCCMCMCMFMLLLLVVVVVLVDLWCGKYGCVFCCSCLRAAFMYE